MISLYAVCIKLVCADVRPTLAVPAFVMYWLLKLALFMVWELPFLLCELWEPPWPLPIFDDLLLVVVLLDTAAKFAFAVAPFVFTDGYCLFELLELAWDI